MQGVATNLLTRFGNPQHIQYIGPATGGTVDDDFPGTPPDATEPAPVPIVGVVTSIERRYVDNDIIRTTDQMLVCDRAVLIEEDGRLLINGRKWTVLRVLPVDPAGQLIAQRVAIRG